MITKKRFERYIRFDNTGWDTGEGKICLYGFVVFFYKDKKGYRPIQVLGRDFIKDTESMKDENIKIRVRENIKIELWRSFKKFRKREIIFVPKDMLNPATKIYG